MLAPLVETRTSPISQMYTRIYVFLYYYATTIQSQFDIKRWQVRFVASFQFIISA